MTRLLFQQTLEEEMIITTPIQQAAQTLLTEAQIRAHLSIL